MRTISVSAKGRMTIPAEAREELGLEGESELELSIEDGALHLVPVVRVPVEDRWAYTPEALAAERRAEEEIAAGRVFELSREDLIDLIEGRPGPASEAMAADE